MTEKIIPGAPLSGDPVSKIIAFENGDMEEAEVIAFFQQLLDTGLIHSLQGSYHRIANDLLQAGLIHRPVAPVN